MIVREIQDYRVIDATTNTVTSQPLDYRIILAPLLYWRIELYERRLTLIEPQSGTLGTPDPNAFMIIVPSSFTSGQVMGIQLLDTDWESEGFATGDVLDMAMGYLGANSILLRATIQGISGQTAMFVINSVYANYGALDIQSPFPLVAFLVNERLDIKAALLRDGDSGFISPLNGQPFYTTGHADSLNIYMAPITNTTLKYNLRLYNGGQEGIIDGYMQDARKLKLVYLQVDGTQFYAYRSSLDPTANTPTQAYPTRGKIVIEGEATNVLRNLTFEADCLLLHPNRIEETNNYVTPGTLTITTINSSINVPSIPSPVKEHICLLGQDSHHSLSSIQSSLDLTSEISPPSVPTASRTGADYVGVVVGQVDGKWVAAMTNRVPSTTPVYNLYMVIKEIHLTRYDCILLSTLEPSARLTGIYTVILYGKVNGSFVPLASYNLNIKNPVNVPFPNNPSAIEILGNLFPFEPVSALSFGIRVANYDTLYFVSGVNNGRSNFYVPIPSAQQAPILGTLLQPSSGYLLDILPLLDNPPTLKAQLICPDGTLLESQPQELQHTPRPDKQLATVSQTPTGVRITLINTPPVTNNGEFKLRVALFGDPADHQPIDQAMLYARENYIASVVNNWYIQNGSHITITRSILTGYSYQIDVNTNGLPPGKYNVHVRSEFFYPSVLNYESFFVTLQSPIPNDPTGKPLPITKCKTEIPVLYDEEWMYIYTTVDDIEYDGNVHIKYKEDRITTCSLDHYCGCFVIVDNIPDIWIDIIGYFRGSVKGLPVPNNAKHKARFRGRIIRLDDEYTSEDFVSSLYRKEDIVRAYAAKYQIEIFADTPCDIANLDILKFAERWDVTNRSNKLLQDTIYNLKPAEISISDSGEHAKVTITLKTLQWRDEYRRQG